MTNQLLPFQKNKYLTANKAALILLLAIGVDVVVVQTVLSFIVMFFAGLLGIPSTNFYLNMFLNICIQASFVIVISIFLRKNRLVYSPVPKDKTPARKKSLALNCAIGTLAVIVSLLCFYGIATSFDIFLQVLGFDISSSLFQFSGWGEIATVFFVVVVCAPIGEELLFRGVLLSGIKRSGYSNLAAVLLSGLAFSLMHMNPYQTVYQFFLGCAIGYITIKCHSLIPAIIMHAANNLFALMMELTQFYALDQFMDWLFTSVWLGILMSIILAAIGAVVIYYLGKLCGRTVEKYHSKKEYDLDEEPSDYPAPAYPYYGFNPYYNAASYGSYTQNGNQFQNQNTIPVQNINGQPNNQPHSNQPYQQNMGGQPNNQPPLNQPYQQNMSGQPNNQPPFNQPYQQNMSGQPNNQPPFNQTNPQNPYAQSYFYQGYQQNPYGYQQYSYYPPQYNKLIPPYKRDPKGKKSFGVYYGISISVCAISWFLVLIAGIFGLV